MRGAVVTGKEDVGGWAQVRWKNLDDLDGIIRRG